MPPYSRILKIGPALVKAAYEATVRFRTTLPSPFGEGLGEGLMADFSFMHLERLSIARSEAMKQSPSSRVSDRCHCERSEATSANAVPGNTITNFSSRFFHHAFHPKSHSRNFTSPVPNSYIAPTILILPWSAISFRIGLFALISSIVCNTLLRHTRSTYS